MNKIYIRHPFHLKGKRSYWNKANKCFGSVRLASILDDDQLDHETCVIANDIRYRNVYIYIEQCQDSFN